MDAPATVQHRSLGKALATLDALAASRTPVTAAQLGQTLSIPRPTVYRILASLADHGYVRQAEQRGQYRLGLKILDLAQQLLDATDLLATARPHLRQLRDRCSETVHLAVPEDGRMVYLDKIEGPGPFTMLSRVGRSVPMHCTALGKSVLAFWPAQRVDGVIRSHGLPRRTSRTLATRAALEQALARVRREGYAVDDVENEEGVRCVGAPVFDHRGIPVAAVSVSAPSHRMSLRRARSFGHEVQRCAATISRGLGWNGERAVDGAAAHPVGHRRKASVRREVHPDHRGQISRR